MVIDWLPAEALCGPRMRQSLDALASAWSGRWFDRRTLSATTLCSFKSTAPSPRGAGQWRVFAEGVAMHCSPVGVSRALDWALDAHVDQLDRGELDQELLDRFLETMLTDLAGEIVRPGRPFASSTQVADPFEGAGGLVVGLSHGEDVEVVSLAIARRLVLPLAKAALPASRNVEQHLVGIAEALGSTRVAAEVELGAADLGFAELSSLAVGDVIVLDHALTNPVELRLASGGALVARALIGERDADLILNLQA